jgi:hypothetical protein
MLDLNALQAATTAPESTVLSVVFAGLLTIVLSGLVAWTYEITFHGLSYSRNFLQSMVLAALVVVMVMQAIGDSIARGLGMMGALAVVRFRTTLTDPKDLVFLFAAIAVGIGCGIYAWTMTAIGTLLFCLTAWILYRADVGTHMFYDGLLRFSLPAEASGAHVMEGALKRHLRHFALISLREAAGGLAAEHAYQIKFRRGSDANTLLAEMSAIPGISGLHFMMQETTTEL